MSFARGSVQQGSESATVADRPFTAGGSLGTVAPMTTLLIPVLRGTLPGFPPAATPGLLDSLLVLIIIPAVIAAVVAIPIMGRRWHRHDAVDAPAPAGELEPRP